MHLDAAAPKLAAFGVKNAIPERIAHPDRNRNLESPAPIPRKTLEEAKDFLDPGG
jgi:hypothetical protein